jgi:glycosyltransferase involved in cell wall biosynthesis
MGHPAGSPEAPYGTLRRVPFPDWLSRDVPFTAVPSRHAHLHVPVLVRAMSRSLRAESRPILLHGFGPWAAAAIPVARRLRAKGRRVACIANVYTVLEQEFRGQWEGSVRAVGRFRSLRYWVYWQQARLVLSPLERTLIASSDVLLGNYASVRRLLERVHGPVPRYRCFPYAPETAFTDERPGTPEPIPPVAAGLRPTGSPCIVSVSRHDPRKGIDILLKALALLRERGVPFKACVISGGPMLNAYRNLAVQLRLPPDQVALPGYVERVRPWLDSADIFCLPSLEEQSGSVSLLEAMQAGIAPVATEIDGIPEDVTHGRHAWLVRPGDPVALADGLERLAGDPELRKRLGSAAQARYRQRFSAENLTTALSDLYASAAGGALDSPDWSADRPSEE